MHRIDLVHLAFGGVGGHLSLANRINAGFQARGLSTGVIAITRTAEEHVPPEAWTATRVLRLSPSDPRAFRQRAELGDALSQWQPRVVLAHTHGLIPEVALRARRAGVDSRLVLREGHAPHLRSWKDGLKSMAAAAFIDATVVASEAHRNAYAPRIPVRRSRVSVIPNPAPSVPDRVRSRIRPGFEGPIRFGMATRLVPGKRVDLAIQSLRAIRSQGVDAQLWVAGDGPERAALETISRSDPVLNGAVAFAGFLVGPQVEDFYASLDVYLHATDGEGESNAVLEAAAAGLPIVASDVTGMRGMLGTSPGIRLVPNRVVDFAAVMAEVCARRKQFYSWGRANMVEVQSTRGLEAVVDRYIALFASLDSLGPWKQVSS